MTDATGQTPAQDTPPARAPIESLPSEWQEYIRDLRQENAAKRVTAREVAETNETLQQQLDNLKAQVADMTTQPEPQQQTTPDVTALQAEIATLKQQLADVPQLREQVVQLRRFNVAAEFGISDFADRLRGDTLEELREDAKVLAGKIKPQADTSTTQADDPPPAKPEPEPSAPDATPPAPPSTVNGQPAQQQPGQTPPASTTTQVPGGRSVGRTDADRRREYFGGATPTAFDGGGFTVISKTIQQE